MTDVMPIEKSPAAVRSFSPSISCIVPAFNEAENLSVLLPLLESFLETHKVAWEIIVIDDGSKDATPDVMATMAQRKGYCYRQFSRNFGKEAAISAGLEAARGDVVVCLDADLQHPPALIADMLAHWRNGADVVFAVRENRDDESAIKRMGSRLLYALLNRGGRVEIPADAGDFRLMDRCVVDALLRLPERTRFMKGLYAWVGFKTESIPYLPPERLHGSSHFRLLRLINFAIDGITAFSTWPLRALSMSGALVALMAFGYGIYLILEYLLIGNEVSGWTTIVTAMLFLSGVNLLGLGVIGAYIGRIFDEVKQRPIYLLRQEYRSGFSGHDDRPDTK